MGMNGQSLKETFNHENAWLPVGNFFVEAVDGAELGGRAGAGVQQSQVLQVSGIEESLAEGDGLAPPGRRVPSLWAGRTSRSVTLTVTFLTNKPLN